MSFQQKLLYIEPNLVSTPFFKFFSNFYLWQIKT